jgi:hypothetical protein
MTFTGWRRQHDRQNQQPALQAVAQQSGFAWSRASHRILRQFPCLHGASEYAGERDAPQETLATVALYHPKFDSRRNRWYVDIRIDPVGSYLPFLRLALARYQPHALPGFELSQIVATEFTQLLPTRSASVAVSREAGNRVMVTLTVAGTRLKTDAAHKPVASRVRRLTEHPSA